MVTSWRSGARRNVPFTPDRPLPLPIAPHKLAAPDGEQAAAAPPLVGVVCCAGVAASALVHGATSLPLTQRLAQRAHALLYTGILHGEGGGHVEEVSSCTCAHTLTLCFACPSGFSPAPAPDASCVAAGTSTPSTTLQTRRWRCVAARRVVSAARTLFALMPGVARRCSSCRATPQQACRCTFRAAQRQSCSLMTPQRHVRALLRTFAALR